MTRMTLTVFGIDQVQEAILQFGPSFTNKLLQPALYAARRPVIERARVRNYGFTDRTGRLRRSLKLGHTSARYFGIRFARGRGAVFAGNQQRAPYAHFVERGHGGPRPARPHPYLGLRAAFDATRDAQIRAFNAKVRDLFIGLVQEFSLRSPGIRIDRRTGRIPLRFGTFRR